jgi:hypothetical protein
MDGAAAIALRGHPWWSSMDGLIDELIDGLIDGWMDEWMGLGAVLARLERSPGSEQIYFVMVLQRARAGQEFILEAGQSLPRLRLAAGGLGS